jgi:hypothetical protein
MLFGVVIFGVAGMLCLIFVVGAGFLAQYQGVEYRCVVDGPQDLRAYPPEAGPVGAGFSIWPVGRECTWPTSGGGTAVAHTDDWGPTIAMVSLGTAALCGGLIALTPPRRLRPCSPR